MAAPCLSAPPQQYLTSHLTTPHLTSHISHGSYSVDEEGVASDSAKVTFEDIDGFEWIASAESEHGYVIIQARLWTVAVLQSG